MKKSAFPLPKLIVSIFMLMITSNHLFAQTNNGIFFQAVAKDNASNPAKNRKIFVQSTIIQTSVSGVKVFIEEHKTSTDAAGMFTISIGNGTRLGGTASNLNTIDWANGPYYLNLKVAISPIAAENSWDYTKEWLDIGTTSFGAVPFAYYAANVAGFDTKMNKSDSTFGYVTPTKLAAKTFDTTSLSNRINLRASASDIATLNTTLGTKLNKSDSLTVYVTPSQLASKTFDTTSLSNRINLRASASDIATLNTTLGTKLNKSDSLAVYVTPSQLASKTFDTTSLSNRINLKANNTDLVNLTTVVNTNTASITSNTASINTNTASITTLLNSVAANTSNITTNSTSINANTASITTLLNSVAANTSNITTNSTSINANTASITANTGSINSNTTSIATLTNSVAINSANIASNTTNITNNSTSIASNTSSITAFTSAIASKVNQSSIGVANGVASLDAQGRVPSTQLPPVTLNSTNVVGSETDMLLLSGATVGSIAIRPDINKNFVLSAANPAILANWVELLTPAAPVQTVNGYTGSVNLTKLDFGLNNVDNTTDALKPISNLTQAALNLKLDASKVGVANGTASLNASGKIPTDQIPAISFSSVKVLNSQSAMLALSTAVVGSVVIRTDVNKNYVLSAADPSVLANWVELLTPSAPVQTVNGYSGNVNIAKSDIGLSNVDNTADASKPISTATQNALNAKANAADVITALALKATIASPYLTGTPQAPTAAAGTNTTQIATTEYVTTAVSTILRQARQQVIASAGQISFTLSQIPASNSQVYMYINGIRTNNNAYSWSGNTLTYSAASNNNYTLLLNDRIQLDYNY